MDGSAAGSARPACCEYTGLRRDDTRQPIVKFLFVHQNFPGQFLHIVRHLVAIGGHEIVFITEPNANIIQGVRKVPYSKPARSGPATHIAAQELDGAVRRAEAVWRTAMNLKHLGFTPDIIIGHHGWGEMMNLVDVWPQAPMLGYFEFYYDPYNADVGFDPEFPADPSDFPRIRAKNAINHIALNLGQHGQTPTTWQLSTYPEWAQPRIGLMWEGVHLDTCAPDPAARRRQLKVGDLTIRPTDKLVTYVSRDLEPYRGFHLMMRTLPHLQRARNDVKVVMIGSDGVSYGVMPANGKTWRDLMMAELGGRIDLSRVAFPGRVPYDTYLSLLKRSDAHVYLTYPFVASWSLRESMAMGCAIVGSDTQPVREFVKHGETGLLASFFDPPGLADKIQELLENKTLSGKLRANARRYAEQNLAMTDYLAAYVREIERLTGQSVARTPPTPAKRTSARKRT
jgi:glycosyltransferase involved in cell wall biosynthesis